MDNPFDRPTGEPIEDTFRDDFDLGEPKAGRVAPPLPASVTRMPSATYHADPAPQPSLSATLAKLILRRSPLHAWHASPRLSPACEAINRKTFDIGRAAHRAVLGAGDDYVAIPCELLAANGAASTAAAKAFIAEARGAGRTPLKADEVEQIAAMRKVAHARLAEHGITLDPARSELSAVVQIDGTYCRAQFDHVLADAHAPILDFKTCEDASPDACLKAIINYGYDVQEGHYRAVWKAATGEDRPFVFIFQEKTAPYEVTLIALSGSFRHMAERRAAKARAIWATCTASGEWPGYPIGTHEVDAPAWLVEREFQETM